MLRHLGLGAHADAITGGLGACCARAARDAGPGGHAGTLEMTDAIIAGVQ
jgi:hypothetical protein